jgi:hypothetical protein
MYYGSNAVLKDFRKGPIQYTMDLNSMIETAAPTPFGWVITTQNEFDLHSMIAFQRQLLSLSGSLSQAPKQDSAVETAKQHGETVSK